ncbi:MAG TPA: hypothetical protein VFF79_15880 [Conexibacter sp.]|nr:hypothetical protein [Conexibacter sp.]
MTFDEHNDRIPGEDADDASGRDVPAPAALRALDDVVVPDRLRFAVAEAVAGAERTRVRRRSRWRGGALVVARRVAVPLLLVLVLGIVAQRAIVGGGTTSPSVHDVAQVALRAPAAPAPAARPGGELLAAHAGPIPFPTWTRAGWHAVGARTDTVGGHELRTVFYADGAGRRIGYAIADAQLPVAGGQVVERRGAQLRVLDRGATSIVTWRRDGRTCVLAGRGVPVGRLLTLASYAA